MNTSHSNLLNASNNALPHSPSLTSLNSGEKIKEKEKAKKKLAQFLDTNVEPLKRFKGLVSFVGNSDEGEIDKVFKDNSYQVYQVILSTFSSYELGTFKQGKHHYAEKEIHKLMEMLKRVLIHLEGFVRKGWQVKSILNILEKMLGIENIASIRNGAFNVFLRFLEVMERPDRYKLDLLASVIDYTPFTPDYTYKINFAKKVFSGNDAKRFIVIQATDPPTREESARLFEQIFNYMSTRMNTFGFWFDLLRSHFLTVMYPSICKKLGILAANDNTGFGTHCPHELQVIVINHLSLWMTNQYAKDYLLSNSPIIIVEPPSSSSSGSSTNLNQLASSSSSTSSSNIAASATSTTSTTTTSNIPTSGAPSSNQLLATSTPGNGRVSILLEMFKQSCKLPLRYCEVIKKSISTFHGLFLLNNDLENIFGEELYVYQTFILQEMIGVFELEASNYEKERESLGMFVIGVFKQLIDNYTNLRSRSREIILTAMLQATTTLLRKSNPNKTVTLTLEQAMVSTTLYAWIKSKETSKTLWDQLHIHFEDLFFRVEVIKQVKSKILQMSMILKDIIYPISEKKVTKMKKDIKSAEKGGEPKSPDTPDPLPRVTIDPLIAPITWDSESCLTTWHFLLDILRNIHRIKEPSMHELAMSIMVEVIDIFLQAEQEFEFSTYLSRTTPQPLPLINIFGPRLFDTFSLDQKYTKGKVSAISSLCKLFCRHHPQYPSTILTHFYNTLNNILNLPSTNGIDLSWPIILNCSNIFNLAMPGSNVLIPTFLYKIKSHLSALKNQNEVCPPAEVRKKCLIMIGSLIFHPNQFPALIIQYNNEASKLTMLELKKEILEILVSTLKFEKVIENKLICLWQLSVFAMEEFSASGHYNSSHSKPKHQSKRNYGLIELGNEAVESIVINTLHIDPLVSRTSLDAISALALSFNQMPATTANHIMTTLCKTILKAVTELEFGNTNITEAMISNHFYCLLDWVCVDRMIFDNEQFKDFRNNLFQAIECALGQKGEMWNNNSSNGTGTLNNNHYGSSNNNNWTDMDVKDQLKAISRANKKVSSSTTNIAKVVVGRKPNSDDQSNDDDATLQLHTKASTVKDAAETLLAHCLNYVHNFPSREGSEIISSLVDESDDLFEQTNLGVSSGGTSGNDGDGTSMPLFTVVHENAIVSVVEVPKPEGGGSFARLFIRDATGKYVWNFDMTTITQQQFLQHQPALELIKMYTTTDSNSKPIVIDNLNYQFENKHSANQKRIVQPADNRLHGLLLKLSKIPECLPAGSDSLDRPLLNLKHNLFSEFQRIQDEVAQFVEQEKTVKNEKYSLPPVGTEWALSPPVRSSPVIAQSSRLLLSYLNLLNLDMLIPSPGAPATSVQVKQLESTQKLGRALQQLDITPVREILKIGLIYVAEGQDEQREILHNDSSSSLYNEFVNGLGWPVDLQSHRGYMGGLDRKKTTGVNAPYFATPTIETIFHNTSSMPTNRADPQQIHKKRHVGNDIVNVIWSEHIRDYSPTTITSQFNDAHIVVYPLPNGLFRVSIYRKESKVPLFGPLIHGMAVSKRLLSNLVRTTAINAYRYVRNATPNYSKPFVLRKSRITEIVNRYQSDRSYVDYIHNIVSGQQQTHPTNINNEIKFSNQSNNTNTTKIP